MAFTQTDTPIWYSETEGDSDALKHHIDWIKWVGATAAGHKCKVKDTDGNIIFSGEASSANYTDFQPVQEAYRGLDVDDLDSGHILLRIDF